MQINSNSNQMITKFKTYETLKDDFLNIKNEDFKSFSINELQKDYIKYNPEFIFIDLIKEMLLNKKIAFQCGGCFDINMSFSRFYNHSIIGICEKVRYEDEDFWDSDIIVKMINEDKWHTLFIQETKHKVKKRIRIYNYSEGTLMRELQTLKNVSKFKL